MHNPENPLQMSLIRLCHQNALIAEAIKTQAPAAPMVAVAYEVAPGDWMARIVDRPNGRPGMTLAYCDRVATKIDAAVESARWNASRLCYIDPETVWGAPLVIAGSAVEVAS